jgi:hydroxyacylglutathione hydrolase
LALIQFKNDNMTVFESQLFKTTSTVIQTDDCVIVVDPTWLPREIGKIRRYVDQIKGQRPVYVVLTHSDWDHVIGYGAFRDATVVASQELSEGKDRKQVLEQINAFDDQYYLDRDYPILYPQVDIPVREDGQRLHIGKTSLTFYRAAGHTSDGLFVVVEPLGVWIAGDYLSDVEFPYIYFSSKEYEHTLAKTDLILDTHQVHFLVPGHGHVAENSEEILRRKRASLHYIKELRNAVLAGRDGLDLINGYPYLGVMKKFHETNVELVRRESMTDR